MQKPIVQPRTHRILAAVVCAAVLCTSSTLLATGPGWERSTVTTIAASEYHFTGDTSGSYSEPNRAQGLRFTIDASGLSVTSRTGGPDEFQFALRFEAVECAGALHPVGPGNTTAERDEARIEGGEIVGWSTNQRAGLEHKLCVAHPPCARGASSSSRSH